ncbi:MAG TPA: hypothetical protein VHQ95_24140 [Pyrinomonadaceae bacterium]|nr:hypothetical protein [Pyrinomonadaceae bacterium]
MCTRAQLTLEASRLATMVIVLAVLLTASTCEPKNPIGSEKGGLASKQVPTNTSAASSPATTTASAGNKIGVPECDDFIAKYEACVSGRVPEMSRAQYQSAVKQWTESWKKLAENPQTRSTLAAACKQAAEQQAASMKTYGCTW